MSLPSSVVPGHVVRPPVAGSLPTAKLVLEVALLQRRLAGRAAIEQAKGMLMERLGCTAVEASEVLTLQSRLAGHRARAEPPDLGVGSAATSTGSPEAGVMITALPQTPAKSEVAAR